MPLSWNEIRNRAHEFSKRWEHETSEDAEAKPFWTEFFAVFGIDRKRVASFEEPVKKLGDRQGYIDLFWKGMLLIEHKSRGKDLDKAYTQALDYFPGIKERDLPKFVLVSDFARFRLYDLEGGTHHEFKLADLHKHIKHFAFIAGYRTQAIAPQNPVNIKAAERMGKLHDALMASGYEGHPLEVLLVRLLFCLFAEDTGIYQPANAFRSWIEERTAEDGSDLGPQLARLFQVLNTPEDKRSKNLDEQIAAFPYVNGKLFEEMLPIADFDAAMREALLDCCALDWSAISPAIFGALFQSIMDGKARRNLGAHYTSEENILKLIKPLFLDELWDEFKRVKNNKNKLFEFHKKLRTLTFFDPACGCGNFLVIAYRELRALELEVLRTVHQETGSRFLNIHSEINVDVDQFHGIEIEEFPAQIAQVALWLVDHQMNVRISEEFGMYFARIPLKTSPHIVHGNALTLDWNDVLPVERCNYVLGNPPFVGHHYQDSSQKKDFEGVMQVINGFGVLDFVTAWYVKASQYLHSGGNKTHCAFVSTNSITQGEQVGLLWSWLLAQGIRIHFAHRTFQWSNEAKGVAAVHCVIIGFGLSEERRKVIFEYEDLRGEPHIVTATNINPYLVDGPNVVITNRSMPLCPVPQMRWGNKPTDGGNLILTAEEAEEITATHPQARPFVRPFISGGDFIDGIQRYCLWLKDAPPTILQLPPIKSRIEQVRKFRLESKAATTRDYASYPSLFRQIAQPETDYLAIPEVSSERRTYIPIAFVKNNVICSNTLQFISSAEIYHFGVLCSTMHNAWMRAVCGRLESRYRYSNSIVYNNFPWPDAPTDKQRTAVEAAAQAVLDARAQFPQSSLADLYDPLTMPPTLVKAHQKLDAVVDACYRKAAFANDAQRVEFLFERYQQLTSLLPAEGKTKKRKATQKSVAAPNPKSSEG